MHGGRAVCVEDETKEWFQVFAGPADWETAKSDCENRDGHLFYALNGTYSQLEVIMDKTKKVEGLAYGVAIWLGIKESDIDEFANVNGESVPNDSLTLHRGGRVATRGDDPTLTCVALWKDTYNQDLITERLPCATNHAYFCYLVPV